MLASSYKMATLTKLTEYSLIKQSPVWSLYNYVTFICTKPAAISH